MDISTSCAIVTGSGKAIGRAIALELARRGGQVVCAGRNLEDVQETVRSIEAEGGQALAFSVDVQDQALVEELIRQTIEAYGRVDILVNNAGIFRAIGALWEADPDTWLADITTNLYGTFLCCHAVLPQMIRRKRGVIINLTGGGFDRPNKGGSGYGASKAGIVRLTDTLAAEIGDRWDIQVYALNPGFVRSGMTHLLAESEAGQRWLPHVGRGLEEQRDHPATDVGRAAAHLVEISLPALSGRVIAYNDDLDGLVRRAEEIKQRDVYQLRFRTL